VVGFKPTFGSLSLKDVVPLSWSFDTAGPLARSVKDAAVSMDVLSAEPGKFTWKLDTVRGDKPLSGLTVGIPKNFFFAKIDADIEANVRRAIKVLGELGATLKEIEIPGLDEVQRITNVIMSVEAFYLHKKNLETRWDEYQDDVRTRIIKGGDYSGYDYVSAVKEREAMQEVMENVWHNVDLLVAASVPAPAYKIGSWKIMLAGIEEEARVMMTRHTRLKNLTGGPGLSVPCGFTSEKLPSGLQIMGRPGDDATVLKAGYAYELACPIKFPVR
jgi:aspartyl-tRNA(Asn)/glutamyl-tRNA(Gln) amidotransferase subunit A